jgi:hypothetical protein
MAEPELRAEYTEDEAYFMEAYDRLPADPRGRTRLQVGSVLLAGLCLSLTTFRTISDRRAGDPSWWLSLVIVPATFAAMWWFTFSTAARRRVFLRGVRQHTAGTIHRGTGVFDESGFVSSRDDGRSKTHLWRDVPRVVFRFDGCFVFIDETTSFWFPHRAFKSAEEFGRLEALIRGKVAHCEDLGG